jgi:hypothetical protein
MQSSRRLVSCLFATLSLAAGLPATAQEPIALSQQDLNAAQWAYRFDVALAKASDTLYDSPIISTDGARGYDVLSRYGDIGYTHDPHVNALKLMRREYCLSSLIVLARDTGETTVLSPNKREILTATQFKIEKILKGADLQQLGDLITFVHFGGTYKDPQGTVLRITLRGAEVRYKRGALYLLQLHKTMNPDYPSSAYFNMSFDQTQQIRVENGHIFPTGRLTDSPSIPNPAHYGESFDAYWKRLTDYLATAPCTPYER